MIDLAQGVCRRAFLPVLLFVSACGGSSGTGGGTSTPTTPTPANRNPTITSVTVSPAFGVSGVTVISMSATATDPDNDAVSYKWTFGAGTSTEPTFATTVSGDGEVPIQLTVTDGKGGSVTDSRSVTIGNMAGRWTFIFTGVCNPTTPTVLPIMTLNQFSRVVTGDLISPAAWCNVPAGQTGKLDPAAPASIDEQGNFTGARLKVGSFQDTFVTGRMDRTGRVITGTTRANLGSTNTFRMVKQ